MDYYSTHYKAYIEKTDDVDPSLYLTRFVDSLPPRGVVLDVGCGTGRDLCWLKKKRFNVLGLERSAKLAEYAEKRLGGAIICADFEAFDFSALTVDGLILTASLVHIPHARLKTVLLRILNAVKKDGILFISLKEISSNKNTRVTLEERTFYLWRHADLLSVFMELSLVVVDFRRLESALGSKETFLSYVLRKVK